MAQSDKPWEKVLEAQRRNRTEASKLQATLKHLDRELAKSLWRLNRKIEIVKEEMTGVRETSGESKKGIEPGKSDAEWLHKHPYFTSGPLLNQNYLVRWKIVEREEQRLLALAMRIRSDKRQVPRDAAKRAERPRSAETAVERERRIEAPAKTTTTTTTRRRKGRGIGRTRGEEGDGEGGGREIERIEEEEEEEEEVFLDLPVSRGKEVLRPLSAPTRRARREDAIPEEVEEEEREEREENGEKEEDEEEGEEEKVGVGEEEGEGGNEERGVGEEDGGKEDQEEEESEGEGGKEERGEEIELVEEKTRDQGEEEREEELERNEVERGDIGD